MPSVRLHNRPTFANVVSLPDGQINEAARGRLASLYQKYGRIRRDSVFRESGISGLQSFGVDYSGPSGQEDKESPAIRHSRG